MLKDVQELWDFVSTQPLPEEDNERFLKVVNWTIEELRKPVQHEVIGDDMRTKVTLSEGDEYWALDPKTLEPVFSVVDDVSKESNWLSFKSEAVCLAYVKKVWGGKA